MQWRIKVRTCKPPVPSSKCPIISQKVKIQVNSVTIKLFRGEYLIDAGLWQTGVVCSCSLHWLAGGIGFMACASIISSPTVTLCLLLPVIFFFFCYWGNIIYFQPPRFALKCHGITAADKVLVHRMISLKDHAFAGVLWRDFLSLDQF